MFQILGWKRLKLKRWCAHLLDKCDLKLRGENSMARYDLSRLNVQRSNQSVSNRSKGY